LTAHAVRRGLRAAGIENVRALADTLAALDGLEVRPPISPEGTTFIRRGLRVRDDEEPSPPWFALTAPQNAYGPDSDTHRALDATWRGASHPGHR
jgi:hypothetical protein